MEVARLTAVIDANTSGFTRAMRGVNGDLDRTARNMNSIDGAAIRTQGRFTRLGGGVGRAMAIGTAAVAGFGVALGGVAAIGAYKAVQSASDLNETVSKTKVIFGNSSRDILAWSKTSTKALGQSQRQALDAASTFAVFGKSAGLSGKGLTGFSKELTTLSADLASFYNTDPEEAIVAIGAALRGESEPIRRFGVLLDDASLRAEAFKQGIVSSTKDALTPQQRALAAHALIMKQTKDAQGDFARTSGGLANQQRIFNAELENAKAAIGVSLLPLATAIMPRLTAAIPVVTGYIQQFAGALQRIVGQFTSANGGMDGMTSRATTLFQQMRGYAIPVVEAFSRIIGVVGQMAQKVGPALGQYLGTAMQTIGRIAAVALPIVADGIEKIGPPIARIATQMLKFSTLVVRILGTVIPPVLTALKPVFSTVFDGIAAILNTIAALMEGDFRGAFRNAVEGIKILMLDLPKAIGGIFVTLGGIMLSKAAEVGRNMVQGIANGIASLPNVIKDKLLGLADGALSAVKSRFGIESPSRVFADEVGKPIGQGIIAGFLDGARSLPTDISEKTQAALDAAKSRVDRARGPLATAFSRMAQGILRAFDAQTAAHIKGIQERLSAAQASVSVEIDARMATRRSEGAALTPAEAELQRERDAYEARERARDKADAQAALAAAQAEGDARAIADAQKRIEDLAYAERIRGLEAKAAEERAIRDRETETALADLETERQNRFAVLQRQADGEQLQYEAHREVMRQKREDELARLDAFLSRSNATVEQKTNALRKFLGRKDIRDAIAQSGTNLGTAFATALENTQGRVTAAVRALAKVVQDYLRLRSPSKLGPLSTLDSWWTAMPDTLLKGVDTSMIGQVAAGIAAPDSGAGFGAGGGAGSAPVVVNVTVQGTVTSERDLVDTIRAELLKTGQRNGSIFGGFA